MRVQDENTWEAEYWDEYVAEFGVAAYFRARYENVQIMPTAGLEPLLEAARDELVKSTYAGRLAKEVVEGQYTSDDLDRIMVERDREVYR